MAMHQQQGLCPVAGCAEPLEAAPIGPVGASLPKLDRRSPVCRQHRAALHIQVDGQTVRFCAGCGVLHPIDHFPNPGHMCRSARQHLTSTIARHRREMRAVEIQKPFLIRAWWDFENWLNKVWDRLVRNGVDAGERSFGSGFVSALRGTSSRANRAALFLYPATCFLLGWSRIETWVFLAGMFCTLHLLAPHIHRQHYIKPLESVRLVAHQHELAISQTFTFLDPSEQQQYEARFAGKSSLGWDGHGVPNLLATGLVVFRTRLVLQEALGLPPALTAVAFLLAGACLLRLRMQHVAHGRREMKLWLDASVAPLLISSVIISAVLLDRWASSGLLCSFWMVDFFPSGMAESDFKALLNGIFLIIGRWAVQVAVIEQPISGILVLEAVRSSAFVMLLNHVGPWYHGAHEPGPGLSLATTQLWMLVSVVLSLAYTARRLQAEARQMIWYLDQKPAKPIDSTADMAIPEERPFLLLAVKMSDTTPEDLPADLLQRLMRILQAHTPESCRGFLRPGCIMLGLELQFGSRGRMWSALQSLLAHDRWEETMLRPGTVSNIQMNIQSSTHVVRDGRLQHVDTETKAPSITNVKPVAWCNDRSTVTLKVDDLGGSGFKVLLRTPCGSYLNLDVVEERWARAQGMTTIVARLPSTPMPGVCWIEVVPQSEDGLLVMSNAAPLLFTPLSDVAKELNRRLPKLGYSTRQNLTGMLQDLSNCLHFSSAAAPRLLVNVTALGLWQCFELLASPQLLEAADSLRQGLLGTAVISESTKMVQSVIRNLRAHKLPVEPCRQAKDARGYSALHWAAESANIGIVCLLLCELPNPRDAWRNCKANRSLATPSQLLHESYPLLTLEEDIFGMLSLGMSPDSQIPYDGAEHGDSVVPDGDRHSSADIDTAAGGATLVGRAVAAIQGCTTSGWARILAVSSVIVAITSGKESVQSLIPFTLIAFATLRFLLPYVYWKLYRSVLSEARRLAGTLGLQVSDLLTLIDASREQAMLEQSSATRAVRHNLLNTLQIVVAMLVFSAPTSSRLLDTGLIELWICGLVVPGCATVLLRAWATSSGSLRLCRLADFAVALYFVSAQYLMTPPVIAFFVSGNPEHCGEPPPKMRSHLDSQMLNFCFSFYFLTHTAAKIILPRIPESPLIDTADLMTPVSVLMTVRSGWLCYPTAAKVLCHSLVAALLGVYFLLVIGYRLHYKGRNLCAFLRRRIADKGCAQCHHG